MTMLPRKKRVGLRLYRDILLDFGKQCEDLSPKAFHKAMVEEIFADEEKEELLAQLADKYGFDGDHFRRFSLKLTHNGRKVLFTKKDFENRILILTRMMGKMRETETDKNAVHSDTDQLPEQLTKEQKAILKSLVQTPHECRNRVDIAAAVELSEGTLKTWLPTLEKKGLIHRPHGPRKGYAITLKGRRLTETSSSQ